MFEEVNDELITRNIDILIETFRCIERRYASYIIIKDFFSIMQMNPALNRMIKMFYSHQNPYCMFIKSTPAAWRECVGSECTQMGREMNLQRQKYSGGSRIVCKFGVMEFYYPIYCGKYIIGAIVMGCTCCDDELFSKIRADAADRFAFSEAAVNECYEKNIKQLKLCDDDILKCNIALCGNNISLICEKIFSLANIELYFNDSFIMNEANRYIDAIEFERMRSRSDTSANTNYTVVLNAITYITKKYDQPITINDIAQNCYCSRSTLSHAFNKLYGGTIKALINRVRCDHAAQMLVESTISITQIASECGFSSVEYFNSVFKKQTGSIPSEYRRAKKIHPRQ